MTDAEILVEVRDSIGLVTLDRPERRNAMSDAMYEELVAAVHDLDAREDVRAIVLTGAGSAFCAGADIKTMFAVPAEPGADARARADWTPWPGLVRAAKPMVAAINGIALGVGLSMVLPFDRIVAGESATFTVRFLQMGVLPELGSSHYLPRRIGVPAATELVLSGRVVEAVEALHLGLVDEVVPDADLLDATLARAAVLGAGSTRHIRWVKELFDRNAADPDLAAVQEREIALLGEAFQSPEHLAAVQTFLDRAPRPKH
ncbi:MAG: enoyl-CoA hydratase-related protein [Aeromicrobium sp.]